MDKIDHLIIGGGMTFTFIKALGGSVGDSICENDKLELALEILEKAKSKNVEIHLPVDVIAADDFNNNAEKRVMDVKAIESGWQGLDAGPVSREKFDLIIKKCKTILWNGPLGVLRWKVFQRDYCY